VFLPQKAQKDKGKEEEKKTFLLSSLVNMSMSMTSNLLMYMIQIFQGENKRNGA
jgi:hypothetical protein